MLKAAVLKPMPSPCRQIMSDDRQATLDLLVDQDAEPAAVGSRGVGRDVTIPCVQMVPHFRGMPVTMSPIRRTMWHHRLLSSNAAISLDARASAMHQECLATRTPRRLVRRRNQ